MMLPVGQRLALDDGDGVGNGGTTIRLRAGEGNLSFKWVLSERGVRE